MRFSPSTAALAALGSLFLTLSAGCGGGGNSDTNSTASRAAATVNLYVTDGFRDDWSQVLVTLYKIEASTDGGVTFSTLYSNDAGQSLDLTSLKDAAQLLSSASLPEGTVTQVRVTLGDTASLTKKSDASTQTVAVDPSLPNVTVAGGLAAFTFDAPTELKAGRFNNLIVDFKLAAFELVSGKLRPSLQPGGASEFGGKQKVAHLTGTVSNYVADSGFDLTPDCGQHGSGGDGGDGGDSGKSKTSKAGTPQTIHVTITRATTIPDPINNGATVMVEGETDAMTGVVTATLVHVREASGTGIGQGAAHLSRAIGVIASLNSDDTSFTLTVRGGERLSASSGTLTVRTTTSTNFHQGKDQTLKAITYADLTMGRYVFVTGTRDATSGILFARDVSLLPDAPSGHAWPTPER